MEQINDKIENALSVKLTNINDTIKSILLNIEKLSEFTTINEKNTTKIDGLINEINALKMLVIKTQTLSLETNNEIIKRKLNTGREEIMTDDKFNLYWVVHTSSIKTFSPIIIFFVLSR